MARQGKGILGAPSKSVGMITGQKHSGKDTIRSKPKPSIKTQTPELTRTKSNFQIALQFYELLINSGWAPVFEKKLKGKTTKNLFIGEIVKLLSSKENGGKRFNPFVTTSKFWKWNYDILVYTKAARLRIFTGYQPYPTTSLPSDAFCFLYFNETTGDIVLFSEPFPNQRPSTLTTYSVTKAVTPGKRFFTAMLFMNFNFDNIFNGYAVFYKRPN